MKNFPTKKLRNFTRLPRQNIQADNGRREDKQRYETYTDAANRTLNLIRSTTEQPMAVFPRAQPKNTIVIIPKTYYIQTIIYIVYNVSFERFSRIHAKQFNQAYRQAPL